MMNPVIRETSLLRDFEEFYSEAIWLRARAESQWASGASMEDTGAIADVSRAIWSRLADLLERQARSTNTTAGDIGYGLYREGQYVMAALADEIFLNAEWAGRDYWNQHLLESHLFNSNVAGEEIFRRVDKLLREPERGYSDIYALYLWAFSLGFRGKYRGAEDGGRIDEIRRRLFIRVYHRKPQQPGENRRLFSNCYDHTLDLGTARMLPSPHRWYWGLAAAVFLWILISTIVWHGLTDDLRDELSKIRLRHNAVATSATSAEAAPAGASGQ